MSGTRWVLLDDSDPGISYTGDWFDSREVFANAGSSGPVYGRGQHATSRTASLSFRFTGTRIRLLGTTSIQNSSGVIDPTWECFVDGQSIGSEAPFPTIQNNWPLCIADRTLSDEEHVLALNVTSSGRTFFFDQIKYLPSPNAASPPPNATVIVEQTDPTVTYLSGNWSNVNASAKSTTDIGASLSISFTGTRISWIGWILAGSSGESSGKYSLDGGPSKVFAIRDPSPQPRGSLFFQTFFESDRLPMGEHNLTVTYQGPNQTALALDHFLIENGEVFIPGNETQPTEEPIPTDFSSTPSTSPSPQASEKLHVGAIVGGAIGGLALICLFALALLFIRRRMKLNLPPIPIPSFRQSRTPATRQPRQSFSEAMVRKPSLSHSTKTDSSSIGSYPFPGYIPVYPNAGHIHGPSPFASSESDVNQPTVPVTRLTPLRRHMVVGTIPE